MLALTDPEIDGYQEHLREWAPGRQGETGESEVRRPAVRFAGVLRVVGRRVHRPRRGNGIKKRICQHGVNEKQTA
jgi:hypothetical protein